MSPSRNFLTITRASWYKPTISSPRDVSALFLNEVNFSLRFAMLSRRQSSLKLITFEGEPRVLWNGAHPVGRASTRITTFIKPDCSHISLLQLTATSENIFNHNLDLPDKSNLNCDRSSPLHLGPDIDWPLSLSVVRCGHQRCIGVKPPPIGCWSSASCLVVVLMRDDDRDDQAVPQHWLLFACRDADWMIRWMMIE